MANGAENKYPLEWQAGIDTSTRFDADVAKVLEKINQLTIEISKTEQEALTKLLDNAKIATAQTKEQLAELVNASKVRESDAKAAAAEEKLRQQQIQTGIKASIQAQQEYKASIQEIALENKRIATEEIETAAQKRRRIVTESTESDMANYMKGRGGSDGRVAVSGADELVKVLNEDLEKGKISADQFRESVSHIGTDTTGLTTAAKQLTDQERLLKSISERYRGIVGNGVTAFSELSPAVQENYKRLLDFEKSLKLVSAAEKDLSKSFRDGTINAQQFDQVQLALINQQKDLKQSIAEVNTELKANQATEQQNIGSIAQKEALLNRLQADYKNLSAQERESVEVGKAMQAQIAGLRTEINGLNGTATSGGIGKILGSISSVAASFGIFLGAYQLVQFGKDLFEIQKRAAGIEAAFARLGNTGLLDKLRTETKGFISDLDLQRLTVKAENFNIPVEKLGTFLLFASQRAKDTGGDVEKLSNNIIDGLGRKSARIIDNLGISLVDIQKEFKRTGDFTTAVSNLIQKEMGQSGVSVDTLADRTNRASVAWENFKKSVGGFFGDAINRVFNADGADTSIITKLTGDTLKKLSDFTTKAGSDRQKTIDQQSSEVQRLSALYLKVKNEQTGLFSGREKDQINQDRKNYGEQLVAAQNVLTTLKNQNTETEKTLRTKKGILSVDELTAKQADLRNDANNIIPSSDFDKKRRAGLLKQADDIQKQLDEVSGKAQTKRDKNEETAAQKREKAIARELDARKKLLNDISDLETKYSNKSISKQDAEVANVEADFNQRRRKIEEFNAKILQQKDKVNPNILNAAESRAVETVISNQSFEYYKTDLDKQKKIFDDFEGYKLKVGSEKAEQRFANELHGNKSFIDYLNNQLATTINPDDKSKATADRKALLEKDLSDEYAKQAENYTKLLESLKTYQTEYENLVATHADRVKLLQNNPDALAQEKSQFKTSLNSLNDKNIESLDTFKKLFQGVKNLGVDAIRQIDIEAQAQLDALVKSGRISQDEVDKIKNAINSNKDAIAKDLPKSLDESAKGLQEMAKAASLFNAELGATLGILATITSSIGGITKGIKAFNDPKSTAADKIGAGLGITGAVVSVAETVVSFFKAAKASRLEAEKELDAYNTKVTIGQYDYNIQLRATKDLQADITKLTSQQLKDRIALLATSKSQSQSDYDSLLAQIQGSGQQVTGLKTVKYGGFLGIGQKTKEDPILAGLGTAGYDDLLKLYTEGKLTDSTKTWFEELKKVHDEMATIGTDAAAAKDQLDQIATGTTAASIASGIVDGFKQGYKSVDDFAGYINKTIQDGLLSSFEANVLKPKIDAFYKEYANIFEQAGGPSATEVQNLKDKLAAIIASSQGTISGIAAVTGGLGKNSNQNTLPGAISTASQASIDLLAGQLGGLRLAQLQGNDIETKILAVVSGSGTGIMKMVDASLKMLDQLIMIQANTGITATFAPYLKTIAQNTYDNTSVALRAAGLTAIPTR